jgi:hypothetical protein
LAPGPVRRARHFEKRLAWSVYRPADAGEEEQQIDKEHRGTHKPWISGVRSGQASLSGVQLEDLAVLTRDREGQHPLALRLQVLPTWPLWFSMSNTLGRDFLWAAKYFPARSFLAPEAVNGHRGHSLPTSSDREQDSGWELPARRTECSRAVLGPIPAGRPFPTTPGSAFCPSPIARHSPTGASGLGGLERAAAYFLRAVRPGLVSAAGARSGCRLNGGKYPHLPSSSFGFPLPAALE